MPISSWTSIDSVPSCRPMSTVRRSDGALTAALAGYRESRPAGFFRATPPAARKRPAPAARRGPGRRAGPLRVPCRSRAAASGSCPSRLPANINVAPNSPSARAQASAAPATIPRRASGSAIWKNRRAGRGAEGPGHAEQAGVDARERGGRRLHEERGRDEDLGHHHRRFGERRLGAHAPDGRPEQALPPEGPQQRDPGNGGWDDDWKADQRRGERCDSRFGARQPVGERRSEHDHQQQRDGRGSQAQEQRGPTSGWRSPSHSAPGPVVANRATSGSSRNVSRVAAAAPPARGRTRPARHGVAATDTGRENPAASRRFVPFGSRQQRYPVPRQLGARARTPPQPPGIQP